jgi:hypothetical protein
VSATDAAVKLVQESLDEKNAELDKVAGPLAAEIKELEAFLKKITRGSGTSASTSGPAIAEQDLLAAVAHVSKSGPAMAKDIAKFLETDTRKIARQLSAYAGAGKIAGNKDEGYTAA